MSDSPLSDTLDDLLFNEDDEDDDDDNEYTIAPTKPSTTNELKIKITKRKPDSSSDGKPRKKKKKSKNQPTYMRRNIRTLLTNDKLQDDTLSALKAEQERLKRLEETNHNYPHLPIYSNQKSTEQECIVLDDDDDDDADEDEKPSQSELDLPPEEKPSIKEPIQTTNDDSNDSDVQYVDSDTETVNDKLTQKLQRLHLDDRVNVPDENGNVLINVNHPNEDPDLYIPKHLCPILKPHQIGGIRFMYDNIVESLQRFQSSTGLGCILAHSMGCGKTVQVITFIDILLRYTTAKTVLIVVPINTIQNWQTEFNRWCPVDDPNIEYKRSFQLFMLNETSKKFTQRTKIVQNWSQTGGTLILGYEMFRLLVTKKNSSQTNTPTKNNNANKSIIARPATPVVVDLEEEEKNFETMEDVRKALLNPDLVICDEGHRIKNHQAGVAVALKSIRTHRRIVLTGYPLQNNLIEYWCMVDFVRPNYLGSKLEFCNMFERPILNGQCIDSTVEDGKLMRARAHVLHSLLEGFIQRRGHDVLQADLPPKTEYVILLKLSNIQRQLYMKFLETVGALSNSTEKTLNPLRAFAICCKIWNHADVLYKFVRDRQDGSDFDFDLDLDQNSTKPLAKTRTSNRVSLNNRTGTVNNAYEQQTTTFTLEKKEFDYDFANSILNSYICGQLVNGIKFQIAMTILDSCIEIDDKVLIFSQSLLSLNKLEEFLSQRYIPNTDKKWEKNINYYRLDGSTSSLEREKLINAFNAPNSNAKLFLLSTRAGCLGINLIAANRVIVMDVSWNPCLDAQAVCRVYRYGQKRHCYIYRLIADFTMEKRIYDRQIAKQGMSDRVVDELQPQNQFTRHEVENLIHFAAEEEPPAADLLTKIVETTDDSILINACKEHSQSITKIPFTHESLLCDRKEHQLTSAEKRRAEKEYHDEKRMNNYSQRARMHPSRSYSRLLTDYQPRTYLHPSPSTSSLFESQFPFYQPLPATASMSPLPHHIQQQTTDRKLEQLKQHGISVQPIMLRSPLEVQLTVTDRELIPAGVRIHLIKSSRGSYIRTPDGKFFAIRPSPNAAQNGLKPLSMPPPPPPSSSSSNSIDQFLFDSSPMPPQSSSNSSLMNDFTDEIDLLIDESSSNNPVPPPPTSSAFENLSSWHNDYFQQRNFFSDHFPSNSTLPVLPSSTNIDTDNSTNNFTFDPLPFM